MGKSVFISYSHNQGDWVWHNLKPCLEAGGAEVHIDVERFKAGHDLTAQMDAEQDAADLSVLVLSPEYLTSPNCTREMQRALACDRFAAVLRVDCIVPDEVKKKLYVDLRDDKNVREWDRLLQACETDLGTPAPAWLEARDAIVRHLQRGNSVNLVVLKKATKPKWRELIRHLQTEMLKDLNVVNCESGDTVTRQGFVAGILRACGLPSVVPEEPRDLLALTEAFAQRPTPARLALLHFDMVADRAQRNPHFNTDLFAALRDLITEKRKLILLIHSHTYYMQLLPANHPLSSITDLKTVELHGRP
ncbi:MAG: toll/interleukin-1 receptor domain-containing protein [candidate division KSB1 bacterium]|nr:toll/interleukin-1 receptor domain-containing protein [candidate division KSB1 bacterium]MDZ7304750.1 toll/interleukin-1 receptor domain-containing protein [candidate division KSB1 bacterium]MDZ7314216.1 toll/interleukin-1 receptor domain-containing protein [candidate division KSB1 bacterium]